MAQGRDHPGPNYPKLLKHSGDHFPGTHKHALTLPEIFTKHGLLISKKENKKDGEKLIAILAGEATVTAADGTEPQTQMSYQN